MCIRQTRTANKATGEGYFTFRLVRGARIEQLMQSQDDLLTLTCSDHIERAAQRYVSQLIARVPATADEMHPAIPAEAMIAPAARTPATPDFQDVDIDSLQQTQPRSVGIEHVALHALEQLGVVEKLSALGINEVMRAAIIGTLIGRMAEPASELSTWDWLQTRSALGELIDTDFGDHGCRHRDGSQSGLAGGARLPLSGGTARGSTATDVGEDVGFRLDGDASGSVLLAQQRNDVE